MKVGLIGAGHRAWAHIAVLKAIPDFKIAAIADPTPRISGARSDACRSRRCDLTPDYHRLLAEQKDLDAVFVVTRAACMSSQPWLLSSMGCTC